MTCRKCKAEIDKTKYCPHCGALQAPAEKKGKGRTRGNGSGSAYREGKTWTAQRTVYQGDQRRVYRKRGFKTKTEALAYLPQLVGSKIKDPLARSLKGAFDAFIVTHDRSKSTIQCYTSAFSYFESLWDVDMVDIDVDDLQTCIDECPKGRRTKENMRAAISLVYKYAIPRNPSLRPLNLAEYLKIYDEGNKGGRDSFTELQLADIKKTIHTVPYAEYVYCHCYLGFRPSALLQLRPEDYDAKERCLTGGIKTKAGIGRVVTVSPKVLPFVEALVERKGETIFCRSDGSKMSAKEYRSAFYAVLEAAGIDNPIDQDGRHKYTPHSARHTFATLMKRVDGADKDKLALIGHESAEQLRDYQDVAYEDLRRITDRI